MPTFSSRGGERIPLSLRASDRYSESYLTAFEISSACLAAYPEEQEWPPVG